MDKETKFDLFLSHNWGKDSRGRDNHDRVALLNRALNRAHVKTWFDNDQINGHIGQAMTDGIDSSEKIAVFVTRRYIDKVATKYGLEDNCRLEFDYSARRKGIKNLIPIVMEPECLQVKNWNGVLGSTLANLLYINYTEDDKLDSCVREIMKRLNAKNLHDEVQLDNGYYKGAVNDKKEPHGLGSMQYNDGSSYEGYWKNGLREGKHGCFKTPTGVTYEGDFEEDEFHGKGVYTEKNGDSYEGDFVHGELDGHGRHILVSKKVAYDGQYKQGKPYGEGVMTALDGTEYKGYFENGTNQGKGKKMFPGIGNYDGNWINGVMEGEGIFFFNNGDVYRGNFQNNTMDGLGVYTYKDGAIYTGQYSKGQKFGQGKYSFKDKAQSYSGEWENNNMDGEGVRVYRNGDTYTGSFVENKRDGVGEMVFLSSNLLYKGEWKNDKMHGDGSVNVENCRDQINVRFHKWRNNAKKMKDLDVRYEEGSLTTSHSKATRSMFGRKKKKEVPGFVDLDEEDGSILHENLTVYSGKTN